ncbi:MAG: lipase [Saprospiraceae bacterium]|nr:lipase [Saprospiraceae bacterium]
MNLPIKRFFMLLYLGAFTFACQKESTPEKQGPELDQTIQYEAEPVLDHYDISQLVSQPSQDRNVPNDATLTVHFQNWLNANGYGGYNFSRSDINGDSYGGKVNNSTPVNKQPVIFIHGNSDKAVGNVYGQSGWTNSLNYFLAHGYTQSELYAITWGDANPFSSANNYHSKENVTKIRAFIEAVLDYTGASKVDIISHSMGVTLCRKAVKGGYGYDPNDGGSYYIGPSITGSIDVFVGIAGANQGLTNCYYASSTPTCDDVNGFYPGYLWGWYGPYGVSDYLVDLNATSGFEGAYRYSIWSSVDQIVGYNCIVYGKNTCKLPGQTGQKAYNSTPYGHFNLKDLTEAVQYEMVLNHTIL